MKYKTFKQAEMVLGRLSREFGAAALSSGVWVYSHWEFPSWVGAFEMQPQSKLQAAAQGGGHCLGHQKEIWLHLSSV